MGWLVTGEAFVFFFSFLSSSLKSTTWLFLLLVFKLRSLFFWFLIFFSFALLEKFYWFSISSFNLKLWYYFFQFDPCCFDFYFFSWPFCKSFNCFQFHHSIHICGILFLPIWPSFFFFFFVKVIFIFNFNFIPSINFLFMSILILIFLIFWGPLAKLIFLFNFTLQSNVKFILYFNFVSHSFNCYFFLSLFV